MQFPLFRAIYLTKHYEFPGQVQLLIARPNDPTPYIYYTRKYKILGRLNLHYNTSGYHRQNLAMRHYIAVQPYDIMALVVGRYNPISYDLLNSNSGCLLSEYSVNKDLRVDNYFRTTVLFHESSQIACREYSFRLLMKDAGRIFVFTIHCVYY